LKKKNIIKLICALCVVLVIALPLSACTLPFSGTNGATKVVSTTNNDDDEGDVDVTPAKTISKDGEYTLTGVIDGQVLVTAENVTLILDGATIKCDEASAILGKDGNGDKVTQNLVVELRGENTVTSGAKHGIQGKDNLTIKGTGTVKVSATKDGLHAGDILTVEDGSVNIVESYEGMEAPNIVISGGNHVVHSSDDGVNAAVDDTDTLTPSVKITGGILTLYTESDGVDSNGTLDVTGGTVAVFINAPRDGDPLDVERESNIIPALFGISTIAKAGAKLEVGSLYATTLETDITSFCLILPGVKNGESYSITANGTELIKATATTTVTSMMGGGARGTGGPGGDFGGDDRPTDGTTPPTGEPPQGGGFGKHGEGKPTGTPPASDGQTA
jgi:hypothetical protein